MTAGYPVSAVGLCTALGADVRRCLDAWFTGQSAFGEDGRARVSAKLPEVPEPWGGGRSDRALALAWSVLEPMTVALADASRRWGPGRVAVIVASDGRPDDSDGYDDALVELARRHARGRGIAFAVTGGTSASGRALETSWRLLAAGRCDAVLCVAVGPLVEARARGWSALGELGSAESRPLGAARDGVRLGEAAAAALIERQSETETALLGVGRAEGNDRGPRAVAGALASSGGEASRVSWVNLGADGRRESDRHLAATVAEALGDRPWVTTPAGLRGHVGAAQDLVAMVETVACIERGRVGPTPGAFDPAFKLRRVEAPLDLETDVAICLGTGSTGDCTAVALGAREP